MGGGGDSRIPSILKDNLGPDFEVVIRTYDFDPEIAHDQLSAWAEEVHPDLVIGESMGATHAIALRGYPHLFVSPSLNAPRYFTALAWLTLIPGVTALFDRIYRPKPGDRQKLHFTYEPLKNGKESSVTRCGIHHAMVARTVSTPFRHPRPLPAQRRGLHPHLEKYFGDGTWTLYDGTHFMEYEYVLSLLIPKIHEVLEKRVPEIMPERA